MDAQLRHERDALASTIRDMAVSAGICNTDAPLTGPHLLMLCAEVGTYAKQMETRIKIAESALQHISNGHGCPSALATDTLSQLASS